ncbi:hypothetical protein GALMADRAFT_1328186 [Galerina marginata CBS 339.88]|uniref:Methyltransferase domain-containing protein n=1 Tax=Galerina marginata (strain CBS 339.88) TaxID=685588 RepID=A0A067T9C0_GALM3|nr:hypothetical protein GALMADRAFT_1328186 [Galerina marginata CBS 339.88]
MSATNESTDQNLPSWELAWKTGSTHWDVGESQPSLKEAIKSSGIDFPRTGRALVPGCGSGYDVEYISIALGLDTLGLEVAETAIKKARELIEKAKPLHPGIVANIVNQDFFAFDPPEREHFELVYDHMFFGAIPHSMRNEWGKQMAKLIKPGGHLVTIAFPLFPEFEGGPPPYIKPEHYEEVLHSNFVKVLDKIPEASSASHEGKERLMIWRRL